MVYRLLLTVAIFIAGNVYSQKVSVIEFRDYLIKEGLRDRFIDTFRVYIEDSQNARGAYILAKYTVKDNPNHFYWIRGFESMDSRKTALEGFYNSQYWSRNKRVSAGVVVNYDNVHLMQPLDSSAVFDGAWFNKKEVAVVDVYIANGRRQELLGFFRNRYSIVLKETGFKEMSYWISENEPNSYPVLPMFQDVNAVITVSLFDTEKEYEKAEAKLTSAIKEELNTIATTHQAIVLYRVR